MKEEAGPRKLTSILSTNQLALHMAHRTDRLGCRWVLEDLEKKFSGLRRRRPKAPRAAVWKDIFASHPAFFKKVLKAADLGACGGAVRVVVLCDPWCRG